MQNLGLLCPALTLSGLGLLILLADMMLPPKHWRWLSHLAWISCAVVLCLLIVEIADPSSRGTGTLWIVDPFAQFFQMTILIATIFCLWLGLDYRDLPESHAGSFSALMLLAVSGLMILVSAADFLLVFVSLELVSLSSFILVGFERSHPKSNEGSMKYFIFGAFSSAILVYGISLYYGLTGTTSLAAPGHGGPVLLLSLVLIFLGFGFKASLAPMHFWVPDAYEGAPTPVTAFLSIVPKIAAFALLLRVYGAFFPAGHYGLQPLLVLLAGLTMTIGNFTAFFQNDVKRLLAYSSIAQAGYLMIGLAVGTPLGLQGVMLYSFIYAAMNIGCFAIAQAVGQTHGYGLDAFDGLSKRSLGLALAMAFCLLSLAGIPPLAGFIGKFYIFAAAVDAGHYGLAALGLVNSVASVYYYFRIAQRMFLRGPKGESAPLPLGPYVFGGLAMAVIGVILLGVYPEPLIAGVRASARLLP